MNPIKNLKNSVLEFKSIYALAGIAMLLALRVVLGLFANATLAIFGGNVKITPSLFALTTAAAMFGPFPAALVGGLGDVLSFFLAPAGGAYFPGFTISGVLTGLIYGFALYKNQVTLPRVIIAWFINMLVVETFLAAYWLWTLNGYTADYSVYLIWRFVSQGIKCVPDILLIYFIGKLTAKIKLQPKKQ